MFFERHEGGERAVLVHLEGLDEQSREDPNEFIELVSSAGAEQVGLLTVTRFQPSARFLVGPGKVDEIKALVDANEGELVIFNHTLSPSQERNLESVLHCRVLDRTGLILDIFAQRARTHEGKLQVELAQLDHLSTRLVRGWTHLERQKGGIGLRGPGETQLETDRRLLRARIKQITKRLEKVRGQREQARRGRRRAEIPVVSLVGYTNAGKSTLFNTLTASRVYAADQLFATLDPTLRRIELAELGPVILADTVGFIRHLPHKLVEAFRATLEESNQADLLLHVIDAADVERDSHIEQVNLVLHEIGAGEQPTLEVYNKVDLMPSVEPHIQRDEDGVPVRVWLSAQNNLGLDLLAIAIAERLGQDILQASVLIEHAQARLRAQFYQAGAVLAERCTEDGRQALDLRLPRADFNRLVKREGYEPEGFLEQHVLQ